MYPDKSFSAAATASASVAKTGVNVGSDFGITGDDESLHPPIASSAVATSAALSATSAAFRLDFMRRT
jgi:hypothetical protein